MLAGKCVFVTGAAKGIGFSIAAEMLQNGATVYAVDRDEQRLNDAIKILGKGIHPIHGMPLNVANRNDCKKVVEHATALLGKIDVLINAAGLYWASHFLDTQPDDYQNLLNVNLFGPIHLMQEVIPGMQARGFGRIINIASTTGKMGSARQSAYSVSKHALIGLTRCAAIEFAKSGVTVNAICPGPVQTEMLQGLWESQARLNSTSVETVKEGMLSRVPINRLIEPKEIAKLAAYLSTEHASGINAQTLVVDGGMTQF